MSLCTVILAAGKGERMRSPLPKVLHEVGGKPLLQHVIETATHLAAHLVVVHGVGGEQVKQAFAPYRHITWVQQSEQLGTGHAVKSALSSLPQDVQQLLVLYGDVPLITESTLRRFISDTPIHELGVLTVETSTPAGLGRVVRDPDGTIAAIIEDQDATEEQKRITEVNTGVFLIPASLFPLLEKITNNNKQREYYLTDLVELARANQCGVSSAAVQPQEVVGVNDKSQLANVERLYQDRVVASLLQQGVTISDPKRVDVRGEVQVGENVVLDVGVVLEGEVVLADGCYIGPYSHIKNCQLGANTKVLSHSVLEDAIVGKRCSLGPFARCRPGTVLSSDVQVGNFVEIKQSLLQKGVKANHLSYLGDATIGNHSNIGAGTVTCNFDGKRKHATKIGNEAFIGSNTSLIAPVTVGDGATVGAGSVIRKDVANQALATSRSPQKQINDWQQTHKKGQE